MSKAHTKIVRKPTTNAHRMVMELDGMLVRCPVDELRLPLKGGWWFNYGYLQVQVTGPSRVSITNVWIDPRYRKNGEGTSMFRKLLRVADKHGVTCELFALAFDRGGIPTSKLWEWYGRLGFVRHLTKQGKPYVNGYASRPPR